MDKPVKTKIEGSILEVTIDRPKANAIDAKTSIILGDIFADFRDNPKLKVAIVTGAGEKFFSAGWDLKAVNEGEAADSDYGVGGFGGLQELPNMNKPIIAAINGPAAGVGFIMALYADIRFAKEGAVFSSAFSKRGLIAEWGVGWILPRLVGIARANDILFSSRKFTAEEAEQMGIVNKTFSESEFDDAVFEYAKDLAKNVSPRSLRIMKEQIYNAQGETISENLESSMQAMLDSFGSEDFKEGVAHFVEKREAKFTGK